MAERSASAQTDGDREFELVLGNKQLFSLLFIVFALLGVFFAMGYTLGRTSAPPETTVTHQPAQPQSEAPVRSASRPSVVDGTPASAKSEEPAQAAADEKPSQAAQSKDAGEAAPPAMIEPKPGQTFMQVSAVARPEAELLVEVLTKKGFSAAIAAGPSDKLFRVLVGPAANEAELVKLKTDLEQSGFKPIPRRY